MSGLPGAGGPAVDFAGITPELLARYDRPGPRYTSYPTADRFVEAFDAKAYRHWLQNRNVGGIVLGKNFAREVAVDRIKLQHRFRLKM